MVDRAVERPFCLLQMLHFCQLLSNPSIDLKLEYIIGKAMKRRFQWHIVCMEILSNFHAQVEYIFVTKYVIETIGPMGANDTKIHPFPWGMNAWEWPHSSCQMTAWSVHALPHNYATKAPLVTIRRPNSPPKLPLPLRPFCHNTLCGLTYRPTNRWSSRMFHNMSSTNKCTAMACGRVKRTNSRWNIARYLDRIPTTCQSETTDQMSLHLLHCLHDHLILGVNAWLLWSISCA